MIFPGSATYKRIDQCTTGRVYLLNIEGNKRFFWMQEPKDDRDSTLEEKIAGAIADPAGFNAGGAAGGDAASQQQLFSMLSGMGGQPPAGTATPPPAGTAATPGAPVPAPAPPAPAGVSMDALQSALAGLGPGAGGAGAGGGDAMRAMAEAQATATHVDLRPDDLEPHLTNPAMQEALYPHVPEDQRNPQALRDLVRSPNFNGAVQSLNRVLQSGQAGALLSSFGITTPAEGIFTVQQLVDALNKQAAADKGDAMQE